MVPGDKHTPAKSAKKVPAPYLTKSFKGTHKNQIKWVLAHLKRQRHPSFKLKTGVDKEGWDIRTCLPYLRSLDHETWGRIPREAFLLAN